ncbi:hypothetical protein Tco_1349009 [Tanacetum coccineum]
MCFGNAEYSDPDRDPSRDRTAFGYERSETRNAAESAFPVTLPQASSSNDKPNPTENGTQSKKKAYFSAVPLAIVTIDLTSASSIDDRPTPPPFSPVKD